MNNAEIRPADRSVKAQIEQLPDDAPEAFSRALARDIVKAFREKPDDLAFQNTRLYDLESEIARQAAILTGLSVDNSAVIELADSLPPIDSSSWQRARISFVSLGLAVVLGWFLGGILSTLLGFLSLGGEIWRPLCIFAAIWLEDYIGSNPRARKIMLAVLGLGGLGRFASALASGMARFATPGALRALISSPGAKIGIFKTTWLWLGSLFLLAFFAKRPSGMDYAIMEESLSKQIDERLKIAMFALTAVHERDDLLLSESNNPKQQQSGKCPRSDCALALGLIPLLDEFDPDSENYLRSLLKRLGYEQTKTENEFIVWDEDNDRANYDPVGLVRNGDKCRILRKPVKAGNKIIKGQVQRLPVDAK